MVQGVEWAGEGHVPPEGPTAADTAATADEILRLRDEVRRLREQIAALAAQGRDTDERIPTYVQGLDGALRGGIPRGHVVGIVGPGGSMKTSLGLYTLVKNRAAGRKGLYVTIEEGRDSIVRTMRRLGLGESEDFIVDISRLRLEREGAEEIHDWVRVLQDFLSRRQQKDPVGLVVIDSLDALASLSQIRDARTTLFHFFHFLRGLGITSLVVAEQDPARPGVDHDVAFLADGVIELRFSGVGEGRVQLLVRVAKMRHVDHSRDYLILTYGSKGFAAVPYEIPRRRRWGRGA